MFCDKNKPYDQQKLFELIGNKQQSKQVKLNLYELIGHEKINDYDREKTIQLLGETEINNYKSNIEKLTTLKSK